MNLGKKFLGFLGRSLSVPYKLIGESTILEKKAIHGGFGRMIGGACFRGGDQDDEIWNGRGRIVGNPLSL